MTSQISHQSLAEFLLAARYGQTAKIEEMIDQYGSELVNGQDNFGTTALHLTAMYGHNDAMNLLLSTPGINTNLKAYRHNEYMECAELAVTYTPLDMAIKYQQPKEMVEKLLNAGASSEQSLKILEWLFQQAIFDKSETEEKSNLIQVKNFSAFEKGINTLSILATKLPNLVFLADLEMPLTVFLKLMNSSITDKNAKILVENLIENIDYDEVLNEGKSFILAKDFTHAFASNKTYHVVNKNYEGDFSAEGHLPPFVVQSFLDSVEYYSRLANYTDLKTTVFAELNTTYNMADYAVKNVGLYDTSKILFQMYSEGKTVLLPTTWEGHAIDIILDKELGLYLVSNAGARHDTLFPGIHAYKNTSPIEVDDIYQILTNGNQYNLEYEIYYKLGLVAEPDFSQIFSDQAYGNCGLYSLLMANWSLTYINIYKYTENPDLSKELANIWHNDLVEHHKTLVLEKYLSQPYFSDDTALYDVLTVYESKLDHPEKFDQATLLLDYLTSPEHIIEFRDFYEHNQQAFSPELTRFMEKKGYDAILHPEDILIQTTELDLGAPETLVSEKPNESEVCQTRLDYFDLDFNQDLNQSASPIESFA